VSRRKTSAKPKYTRADVQAAVKNLIRRGLIVERTDINGKVVYFPTDSAPPPGLEYDPGGLYRRSSICRSSKRLCSCSRAACLMRAHGASAKL